MYFNIKRESNIARHSACVAYFILAILVFPQGIKQITGQSPCTRLGKGVGVGVVVGVDVGVGWGDGSGWKTTVSLCHVAGISWLCSVPQAMWEGSDLSTPLLLQ